MATDFNHLMPKATQRTKCPDGRKHKWSPSGTIEAKVGNNIRVDFYCTKCDRREITFLSAEQYVLHEKILINNIEKMRKEIKPIMAKQSEQNYGILLPEDYKPDESPFAAVRVLDWDRQSVSLDLRLNEVVIVNRSMIEEVKYNENTFYVILENYVMGLCQDS